MKKLLITLFAATVLVACNGEGGGKENLTMEIEDLKEVVHEYSVGNMKTISASITSHQLIVTNEEEKETLYDVPKDEFFVSIAPYINETHPCENHSLTGCQGELVQKDVAIYIEDTKGNVVVDETIQTLANGFIDLWLPRDKTYKIKMEHEGKMVESAFSTFENDGTCITTMQLL